MTQPLTFFYDPTLLNPAAISDGSLVEEAVFPGVELTNQPFVLNQVATCTPVFNLRLLVEKNSHVEEIDEI